MKAALYLGLISGTSADGIDVALASFAPRPKLVAGLTYPYPPRLREAILRIAQSDGQVSLDELGALDVLIGRSFADAASELLQREGVKAKQVRALGSHGQTIRHRPLQSGAPYTLQIGDANIIAEQTGILTVADFRRRDVAAGGHGAPLAPVFHAAMLGRSTKPRVVLNLGGIANITILSGLGEDADSRLRYRPGELPARRLDRATPRSTVRYRRRLRGIGARRSDTARTPARRSLLRDTATEEHRPRGLPSDLAAIASAWARPRSEGRAGDVAGPDGGIDRSRDPHARA